jgi:hypothetical protein
MRWFLQNGGDFIQDLGDSPALNYYLRFGVEWMEHVLGFFRLLMVPSHFCELLER